MNNIILLLILSRGRSRTVARSDHRICRCRASLLNKETRPAVVVSGKPPALYLTCRQATHLGTTHHTGYISPSVATSADIGATRPHTMGYQGRPFPRNRHSYRNSEPRHFKARHSMNRPPNCAGFTITPGVARPTASSLICLTVSTPRRLATDNHSEDKSLASNSKATLYINTVGCTEGADK